MVEYFQAIRIAPRDSLGPLERPARVTARPSRCYSSRQLFISVPTDIAEIAVQRGQTSFADGR